MMTLVETKKRIAKYRFYKYRTMHSWGRTVWKMVRLPEGWDSPREYFDELSRENSWSDKYHGLEWKKASPPQDWLEKEIVDMRDRANEINQIADDYCWILHELENKRRNRPRKTS